MRREEGGGCGVRVDVSGGGVQCSAVRDCGGIKRRRGCGTNKRWSGGAGRWQRPATGSGKRTFRLLGGCSSSPFSPSSGAPHFAILYLLCGDGRESIVMEGGTDCGLHGLVSPLNPSMEGTSSAPQPNCVY